MSRTVAIAVFDDGLDAMDGEAIVAVDVLRATTTAVTAALRGFTVYPASNLAAARTLAALLERPVLAGELGGDAPVGFDLGNSPAAVAERDDPTRPLVLLSSSATRLICTAGRGAYVACLRPPGRPAEAVRGGAA